MTRFERWAVWSTSVATFATGLIYLWMKYLLVNDDPLAIVNHPWQGAMLKAHILVAPLLVFSIGLVALRHVWRHLTGGMRYGRRSGLLTVFVLGPMIVTGYLIQAVTHQGWLRAMAFAHIGLGLLYGLGLLAHQFAVRGRNAREASARARRHRRTGKKRRLGRTGRGHTGEEAKESGILT
jgi:hypothetical protein